jgi:hypothetical protein
MKTRELTRNQDSKKMTLLKLPFIALIIALSIIGNALFSQEAIKMPKRTHTRSIERFKNIQGFALPVSVPDSTRVYQIEGSKSKFYFRRSSNTGKLYKVYLKTDSATVVNEPVNK